MSALPKLPLAPRPMMRPVYIKTPDAMASAQAFERVNRAALMAWYDEQCKLSDDDMPPYLEWCAVQYDIAEWENVPQDEPPYQSREDYEADMAGENRYAPL